MNDTQNNRDKFQNIMLYEKKKQERKDFIIHDFTDTKLKKGKNRKQISFAKGQWWVGNNGARVSLSE